MAPGEAVEAVPVLLQAFPFQDVTPAELEAVLPSFGRRHYRRAEWVWLDGDDADHLWFVITGQIKMTRTSRDGAEVVVGVCGRGESFGEPGLFGGWGRVTNCLATEPSLLFNLHREPLLAFLESHPAAMRRMLESVSRNSRLQVDLFSGVAMQDIRGRVAARILQLADSHGESAEGGGVRISLRLSQATLAGMAGASRENVNRALAGFLAAGDIRRERGRLVVVRPDALRRAL